MKKPNWIGVRGSRLLAGLCGLSALSFCLALPLLVTGCVNGSMSPSPTAPGVTITANPTAIAAGASSVLTVAATHATQVTISGSDGSSYTLSSTGGTQSVSPKATTTYTATATGAGGSTTASATVTVTPPGPPTVTITANPTSVAVGGASVLTVTATNATQVTVTGSDGSSYPLQPSGGTPSVNPTATTTYTATATGAGGTATATATVTVIANPLPTVTITANPASIQSGSSSILTVTAQNATQVTLTGSDGSSYTLTSTGGTQAVSPTSTTTQTFTYTATATGPGGTATATATLEVTPIPAPTVTITANPTSVSFGNSSTLTVTATNATQVTITGDDGESYTLPKANGGIQSVTPTNATTTYTATATGPGGSTSASATVTVTNIPTPSVNIAANPATIAKGNPSLLTITATYANQITIAGSDGSSYTIPSDGGTQAVSPTSTTTYTVSATGPGGGPVTAQVTVTVVAPGTVDNINHVVFLLQENHTFDNYFGMLNPYRQSNSTNGQAWNVGDDGNVYNVDGIADKLNTITNPIDLADGGGAYALFPFTSTCVDDMSSDWLASFGDVNRFDFSTTRTIKMDGFVHNAAGFAKSCVKPGATCSGQFTDLTGERSMGYYDQHFLNYYYYMASQFALSDRWFSPVASKSISNRIATFTGGTTQGLVKDPGLDDGLAQLNIPNIFQELDAAHVSWKIYYTVTQGFCLDEDDCTGGKSPYPATNFSNLTYSYQYLYGKKSGVPCTPPTQPSSVVGDITNSFCIDTNRIAPISQYYVDLTNGTLPSFAFIEAGYGQNDEHPGSGQPVWFGQKEVAKVVAALMNSSAWKDSVFFFSYDEGGGPYDHVPPVPGHSNDFTDPSALSNATAEGDPYTDISSIAVNPDTYYPCVPPPGSAPNYHCDLLAAGQPGGPDPGAQPTDAAAVPPGTSPTDRGFAAQLGFRLPNMVISPFSRKHYVSHTPMDHTAVIKFVEDRFIGPNAHLTARDAAQPNLLNFFDFTNPPWSTPPTPPTPYADPSGGPSSCTPSNFGGPGPVTSP